jgi:hypothetical protein
MSLDQIINRLENNEFVGPATLLILLHELKTRRESDLRPANKFLTNTVDKQIAHIRQEFNEMLEAKYNWQVNTDPDRTQALLYHFATEIVDMQSSGETLLAMIGYDEFGRQKLRRDVIAKNTKREYYREAGR